MWIKNTKGKKDAMLTFATVAFLVITLNVMLASFDAINIGGMSFNFKQIDSSIMTVYLGATFSAYVTRRLTDSHYDSKEEETKEDGAEAEDTENFQ